MSLLDPLRKAFGYVLLSMGVSRPAPKGAPAKPAPENPAPEKSGAARP
jgi:hypothetical protein